ncbi:unnamed protein product [Trifolium pratense]|uniref:Uncharacterized protein n=1 Tax=Trifolium pratense TaxID=57577 RepID=A0ACB0L4B0_TRIPR|nr:unnamed protein product [Trifolium pratense]
MNLGQVHMNGGDGETSYANNSFLQRKPEKARNLVELAESFWLKPEKATDPVELAESFWLKPEKATDPVVLAKHFWLQPEKARRAGR